MKSMMRKTTFREIKHSFGRFFAILAIVALGVGFFAGLKVTRSAMVQTVDDFLKEKKLYDLRLVSTLGFEEEDIESLKGEEDIASLQGAISEDVLCKNGDENEITLRFHTLTDGVNGLELRFGRMPEAEDECVVDSNLYTEDKIGEKIILADDNEGDTLDIFKYREYTIVGIADASYYMNFERGTTSLGTGRVSGYVYVPVETFDTEYYTEVFVKFQPNYTIYTDEYENFIDKKESQWETIVQEQADKRYQSILDEANAKLGDAKEELENKQTEAEDELNDAMDTLADVGEHIRQGWLEVTKAQEAIDAGIAGLVMQGVPAEDARAQMAQAQSQVDAQTERLYEAEEENNAGWDEYHEAVAEFDEKIADAQKEIDDAQAEIDDLDEPDTYVLTRESNIGYVCFESDSNIVDGIANVFPIFFFLVAALVCMTTMNRMIEEQRTQIGVLKALGYGESTIMGKYLFYSGSAATIGAMLGYALGTFGFPRVIWTAYGIMYQLPQIEYVFDWKLAAISMAVALLCSMGTTWLSCRYELFEVAAQLMRPKSPKAGKRVLLERIPFIWKRMKFLRKVSARNIFRYKKRFFMMIIGISGCTALVVTGLGIKDSITNLASQQFDEIQIYDAGVTFRDPQKTDVTTPFTERMEELGCEYTYTCEKSLDLVTGQHSKSVNLVIMKDSEVSAQYVNLHTKEQKLLPYPETGKAILSERIAKDYGIKAGDAITLRDSDMNEMIVTVEAIAENYVYDYVYMNEETYQDAIGAEPEYKSAYWNLPEGMDAHQTAAGISKIDDIAAVTINADTKERVGSMMDSLDMIVVTVVICAAILALIVLYNLTNINITERNREIATIKVLGFYKKETAAYVFSENTVLTAIGAMIGLLLGKWLHAFVMSQIKIDMVSFDIHVEPISYVYSILLTFLFAWLVDLLMRGKLEHINMAESLKSVD